ncbi:MAG: DUF3006 domain-containing protein [Isosphaeraceae bacterium]|nr:DUF3006 domain-containing protein [Isosphaeraceae bacterium]
MTIRLAIDRFEGDDKQVAVLLSDDDQTINFPRALLPKGAHAGDVLAFTIERDVEATKRVARETKAVQDELESRDTGGDLKL